MARNAWFGVALLALRRGRRAAARRRGQGRRGRPGADRQGARAHRQPGQARDQRIAAAADSRAGRRLDARRRRSPPRRRPATARPAADSLDRSAEPAAADSVQRAREIEVMRETFAYAGGTRDPFASLIDKDNSGPEIGDLDLVGVYLDLRTPDQQRRRAAGEGHPASGTRCGWEISWAGRGWCRSGPVMRCS